MTTFKAGDRVEYTNGPVYSLRGKLGTVNGLTRDSWIEVDFDHGDSGIKCSDLYLRHVEVGPIIPEGSRDRTNRDVKPLLERGVSADADEALEALVKLIPEDKKGEADKHVRMLTHAIAGYGQLKSAIRTLRAQAAHAADADKGAVQRMKSIHTEDIYIKVK